MGGSVNLQGGGQYSMPNIQGYGQNAANIGQSAAGFGSRFGNRFDNRFDNGFDNRFDNRFDSRFCKRFDNLFDSPCPSSAGECC